MLVDKPLTVKRLRKLNKWIKTDEQAKKIIKDYYSKPKVSLNNVINRKDKPMPKTWNYNVLDHKYENIKRWFQAMADNHPNGLKSVVLLDKIIGKDGMFEWLEKTEDKILDASALIKLIKKGK